MSIAYTQGLETPLDIKTLVSEHDAIHKEMWKHPDGSKGSQAQAELVEKQMRRIIEELGFTRLSMFLHIMAELIMVIPETFEGKTQEEIADVTKSAMQLQAILNGGLM